MAVLLDQGPREGVLSLQGSPTDPPSATPTRTPSPSPSSDGPSCRFVLSGEPSRAVLPPGPRPGPEEGAAVLLRTSAGDIDLVLDATTAPCAVHSLTHLARVDFYDGTPCHRLVDRGIFVLQCGDPTGTGQGGPGYRFAEEGLEDAAYPRGTVAMVNSGPDTTGSQFFLVYDDSPLPAQYTPVGTIGEAGLAVLDAVAAAGPTVVDGVEAPAPALPVQVLDVEVTLLDELPAVDQNRRP